MSKPDKQANDSPPPGDFIRDELKARGWTQEDLSRVMGRPLTRVNEIIQGKQGVTPETAVALAIAFDTTADVWLRREAEYRLCLQRQVAARIAGDSEPNAVMTRRKKLFSLAPIRELQKRGWIGTSDDIDENERDLMRLFGVTSIDDEPPILGAMRKTAPHLALTPAQKVWACRVRQVATAFPSGALARYDESRLPACRAALRKLAAYSAGVSKVPALLANYGIRFVAVEGLSGAKADGYATWLDPDSPVIGMTLKYDRLDSFWFTLGHEVTHIHYRDIAPVDGDVCGADPTVRMEKTPMEQRADDESAATFIPPEELNSFIQRVGPLYSTEKINQFANRIKVHPSIIVGQLKHRDQISPASHNKIVVPVREAIVKAAITDGWGETIDPGVIP